ncbi:lipopolysaccharide biosynthesis protein [Shewanella gaetbuli]|uniref:Lipopolysaccharide biosynthesis protein n=1 Tax=Shewanella gaetbuli TaxID=220752 RepID=A0A9X2CL48_9GAMM|nr:lipopolysaccharide biosynthesis protein [Shewanella gaetbuli]MCL1142324.1 lipopolysaccharide biosynthesis protein [Shewanella gaetbuli]
MNIHVKETVKAKISSDAITPMQRKIRKLKRDPKLFIADSKAYVGAKKTLYLTRAKLGSFIFVILASLFVIVYYGVIASPRYTSQVQFVVKEVTNNELPVMGLGAIGATSTNTRDALILQTFITSAEMALALDKELGLKEHYQSNQWDWISRLKADSTQEEFIEYYQDHIRVVYDDMSEVLNIEVQGFEIEFSLKLAEAVFSISETFINHLSKNMVNQQMEYAQSEVERAYAKLKSQQVNMLKFQNENTLYNPEVQSAALVEAVNQLESAIIDHKTQLKSLHAYMREDAAEIRSKEYEIKALEAQLVEEKLKLTNQDSEALNKVNIDYKDLELNTLLAADLYKSSLASLESVRAEAFNKLKYLLVVEHPRLAEQEKYPKRLYNIFTWFIALILIYLLGRLIASVIKEHKE